MSYMKYQRVGSGRVISPRRYSRGFRLLNPRRVLVLIRLRKRFTFILRLFHRLKLSLHLLKRVFCIQGGGFKRINLVKREEQVNFQCYYVRSNNSIYVEEAIADCLEFIKRTSISSSMDQSHVSHIQDRRNT
ncbi:hypothetical protein HN51_057204 [Arachis hypogaea]|nr:uncharacterized protein DS421_20g677400 [Arachis hypogaea]